MSHSVIRVLWHTFKLATFPESLLSQNHLSILLFTRRLDSFQALCINSCGGVVQLLVAELDNSSE